MTSKILTQDKLKQLLSYDPETGVFTWIVNRGRVKIGTKCGCRTKRQGYLVTRINGKHYLMHRLAFLYMEGAFPQDQVDHVNRIKDDNRWGNLRHSATSENCQNKTNNNSFIGVHYCNAKRKWIARTSRCSNGRRTLGRYKTHLAACYARHDWDFNHCGLQN